MLSNPAAAVDSSLEQMRVMLGADGYELVSGMDDDRLRLAVVATPEACAECLVPKDLLKTMAHSMLTSAGVDVAFDRIDVTYPDET